MNLNQTKTRNFMKSKFDYLLPLLAILVIGLTFSTYRLHRECQALRKKASQLENTAANIGQAPQTSTVVKTDSGDITVVATEPLKATAKVTEARYRDDMEIARETGVRPKDVDEMSHIEVSTSDSVTVPVKTEPFGGLTVHFEDSFARIDVRVDSMKTAVIDYEVRDSVVVLSTHKRHSILFGLIKWKGKAKVQAYSRNPKARVTSLEVLERLE